MYKNFTFVDLKYKLKNNTIYSDFIESIIVKIKNILVSPEDFILMLNKTKLKFNIDYDIEILTENNSYYEINFKKNLPNAKDYLIVTANDGINKFNKLVIFFSVKSNSEGITELSFLNDVAPGNYKIVLDTVNCSLVNKESENIYKVVNETKNKDYEIDSVNLKKYDPNIISENYKAMLQLNLKDLDGNLLGVIFPVSVMKNFS